MRKYLQDTFKRYEGGNGFYDGGMPRVQGRAVVVSDDLTRMHRFSTADRGGLTGLDLFEQWFFIIHKALESGTVSTYICCYDCASLMPKAKIREQAKRRVNHVPYHIESVFCDEGIKEPMLDVVRDADGKEQRDEAGKPVYTVRRAVNPETGELEIVYLFPARIDITRLMQTTALRPRLYRFIIRKLQEHQLPPDTCILFDAAQRGPVRYRGEFPEARESINPKTKERRMIWGNIVQLTDVKREFGEADLQVLWWTHQIPAPHPVFVESIDCDLMVLLTWFYENTRRPNVYWVFTLGAYMDVAQFWNCVTRFKRGKPMRNFVRGACACGNDFVDKGEIFFYFNEGDIMNSVGYTDNAMHLVRHAYTHKLKKEGPGDRIPVLEYDAIIQLCSDSTRHRAPRLDHPVWKDLEWNVNYWCQNWAEMPLCAALKEFRW